MLKLILGITLGDPCGIGPEILLKAWSQKKLPKTSDYVAFGNVENLKKQNQYFFKRRIISPVQFFSVPHTISKEDFHIARRIAHVQKSLLVVDIPAPNHKLPFGRPQAWAGQVSGASIYAATQWALQGTIDALVTLPINKQSFALSEWGKKFVGHTEMLASLTHTKNFALMLVNGPLRAIHVTQHVPLKKVPQLITKTSVKNTILVAYGGLTKLGIKKPRLAVCGLNPHAGDDGVLGSEEKRIITPVVHECRKKGLLVEGPFGADTVWPLVMQGHYDAGVAMYHDQGQIAVKLFQHHRGVNVTLGIPIIRTSVAHGTGFDIAGLGTASTQSFIDAVVLAISMTQTNSLLSTNPSF